MAEVQRARIEARNKATKKAGEEALLIAGRFVGLKKTANAVSKMPRVASELMCQELFQQFEICWDDVEAVKKNAKVEGPDWEDENDKYRYYRAAEIPWETKTRLEKEAEETFAALENLERQLNADTLKHSREKRLKSRDRTTLFSTALHISGVQKSILQFLPRNMSVEHLPGVLCFFQHSPEPVPVIHALDLDANRQFDNPQRNEAFADSRSLLNCLERSCTPVKLHVVCHEVIEFMRFRYLDRLCQIPTVQSLDVEYTFSNRLHIAPGGPSPSCDNCTATELVYYLAVWLKYALFSTSLTCIHFRIPCLSWKVIRENTCPKRESDVVYMHMLRMFQLSRTSSVDFSVPQSTMKQLLSELRSMKDEDDRYTNGEFFAVGSEKTRASLSYGLSSELTRLQYYLVSQLYKQIKSLRLTERYLNIRDSDREDDWTKAAFVTRSLQMLCGREEVAQELRADDAQSFSSSPMTDNGDEGEEQQDSIPDLVKLRPQLEQLRVDMRYAQAVDVQSLLREFTTLTSVTLENCTAPQQAELVGTLAEMSHLTELCLVSCGTHEPMLALLRTKPRVGGTRDILGHIQGKHFERLTLYSLQDEPFTVINFRTRGERQAANADYVMTKLAGLASVDELVVVHGDWCEEREPALLNALDVLNVSSIQRLNTSWTLSVLVQSSLLGKLTSLKLNLLGRYEGVRDLLSSIVAPACPTLSTLDLRGVEMQEKGHGQTSGVLKALARVVKQNCSIKTLVFVSARRDKFAEKELLMVARTVSRVNPLKSLCIGCFRYDKYGRNCSIASSTLVQAREDLLAVSSLESVVFAPLPLTNKEY